MAFSQPVTVKFSYLIFRRLEFSVGIPEKIPSQADNIVYTTMSHKPLSFLLFLTGAAAATGQIVISELMFSVPAIADQELTRDYIEIVNAGNSTVDIGGWYFDDEDANPTFIPEGTVIRPGEALVVTDRDPAEFRTAWGLSNSVKVLDTNWRLDTNPNDDNSREEPFAIDPFPTNDNPERLGLFRPNGELVDQVNYFNGRNGWPSLADKGTGWNPPSIYLPASAILAAAESGSPFYTDNPSLWIVATTGVDGARLANNAAAGKVDFFWSYRTEVGSPGFVQGITDQIFIPEAATAGFFFGLIGFAAVAGRRRR